MQDISDSSSLQIDEPENIIQFSGSSYQSPQEDQLNYSRDEPSLSFVLQQQRRQAQRRATEPINNQPPKRKRREIFGKYKQQNKQFLQEINGDDDLLRIFDEVFKIATPRDQINPNTTNQTQEVEVIKDNKAQFAKKGIKTINLGQEQQKIHQSHKKLTKQNQIHNIQDPISENKNKQISNIKVKEQQQSINEDSNFFNSSAFFQTPAYNTPNKNTHKLSDDFDDIQNFSDIQNRLSYIENKSFRSSSKDVEDLASILNTQVFQQQEQQRKKEVQQSQNLGIQSRHIPNYVTKDQMASSRSTMLYQKIDESSMASSVMMKDSRFTMKQIPSDNHHNLLGSQNQKRSNTMNNIFGQQKQSSPFHQNQQKQKQYIFEQSRIPIFLRKVRYLNQINPNFNNKSEYFQRSFVEEENRNLQQLIGHCKIALKKLENIFIQIQMYDIARQQLYTLIKGGVSLEEFINFKWQRVIFLQNLEQIRPKQRYQNRRWDGKKAQKALENYKKIVEYYYGIKINMRDERGLLKYQQIRKKFWDIQRNIRMMSQDMYTWFLSNKLPSHYHEYYQLLKQSKEKSYKNLIFHNDNLQSKSLLLQKALILKQKRQVLTQGEVGKQVIKILKKFDKFYAAF